MAIVKQMLSSFLFWGAWIVIPVLMEIIPAVGSIFLLLRRKKKIDSYNTFEFQAYPDISIIVPVYNSQDTLFACIKSIYDCEYPNERIRVFLVNNKGQDDSFSVFAECQHRFPELKMQWLDAEQGKSRALNMALYNSEGKYIINIDSDGVLEKSAIVNLIRKYEANPDINCMTGTIMTTPYMIEEYKGFFHKLLRKLEFMEYAQAFLAGRSYASELNTMYTLSGAFSSFRKSAILSSKMYNTDTVGEDTHLTFQMRYEHGEKVEICENAIFYTDPIEDVNKLYTQRQRWQRGSLEVGHMFAEKGFSPIQLLKNINVRTLMYDHTFAFPRMIWYLAILCLMGLNFSVSTVLWSAAIIFGLYIGVGYFYFFTAARLLKLDQETHDYYIKQWWCVILLPFFNMFTFFIRFAGIVNSIQSAGTWRTRDFKDERRAFADEVKKEMVYPTKAARFVWKAINKKEKQPKKEKERKTFYSWAWYLAVGLVLFLGVLLNLAVGWSKVTFGVEINEIINTLLGPVEGTGDGMKSVIIKGLVIPMGIVAGAFLVFAIVDSLIGRLLKKKAKRKWVLGTYHVFHKLMIIGAVASLVVGLLHGNLEYDLISYYAESGSRTTIYEDYYVHPDDVKITPKNKTKNLIYIYVESLETTYASKDEGGKQNVNYMPKLTALAKDNVSFSDNGKLSGFHMINGTNWTLAALFSTTSGIPYALPADDRTTETSEEYMPGVVNLGDILKKNGYVQEFLCGSDGSFAGRKKYFEQHGDYKVFDVYSAREAGYVAANYWKNWGIEDKVLFDIARKELTNLSSQGKPFNFTMLTVDLHATDGFICDWCKKDYEGITPNVVDCNDRMITEFLDWCKKQPFYEDTMIVITGDHPRMDTSLVANASREERTVYNCFMNSAVSPDTDTKTRTFTSPDILPTVLAGMGFEIEGERLGLGTNLFSKEKTLAEEKGFDWLYQETSKASDYYVKTFALPKK